MNDLKLAFRRLLREPGFSSVSILTLGLCLGATLAILAVVDAILIRALPFKETERLAVLFNSYPRAGVERVGCSLPNYFDRRGSIPAFESLAIYQESSVILGDSSGPRRIPILRISPDFFSTLGVPLALGAPFTEAQLAYAADEVAILTHEFWRSHFNGDPQILGRTFLNDGATIAVVGILPPNFKFLSSRAQFFRPASHARDDRNPSSRHSADWNMIARLAPGVGWREAQAQMDVFNARQALDDPSVEVIKSTGYHTQVRSLREDHVQPVKKTLFLLQVGVLMLLVMACVNLANLLLIRSTGRTQEFAVREALGAGRWRLARGQILEILILVSASGLLAMGLGLAGIRALQGLGADQLPLGASIQFDFRTGLAAAVVTLVVGGLLSAFVVGFGWRSRIATGLRLVSRGGTSDRTSNRLQHAFVVAQVALAFLLLSGAGLLGLSLKRILSAPPGFTPSNVTAGRIAFPWQNYTNQPSRLAFVDRLIASVRVLPGIDAVAVSSTLPFGGDPNESGFAAEGYAPTSGSNLRGHYLSTVTGDFGRAMGITLLRGRFLEDADRHRAPRVCVVDQAVAELYWPGTDPIGKRVARGEKFTEEDALVVVGVVSSIKHHDLTEAAGHGAIYQPYGQLWPNSFALVVRSSASPSAIGSMLRQAVQQLDPGMPLDDLRSMQSRIDDSLVGRRSPAVLAWAFAAVALLLSALGTYGVLAYAVSRRQREIGVRMALGALPAQVLMQFLKLGARLCCAGLAAGVAATWAAGQLMKPLLYGVHPLSGIVLLATALGLATVVGVAIAIPSSRASRVNPVEALRTD